MAQSILIPEGVHPAKLAGIQRFASAFGDRLGLRFEIIDGEQCGVVLMQSAAPSLSPKSKLADLMRGLIGREPYTEDLKAADAFVGSTCKIVVRHERNRDGRPYAAIVQTLS